MCKTAYCRTILPADFTFFKTCDRPKAVFDTELRFVSNIFMSDDFT